MRLRPVLLALVLAVPAASAARSAPNVSDHDPAWSPDGAWIAYANDPTMGGDYDTEHVIVMRPDGRDARVVANGKGVTAPQWLPDSRTLVFERADGIFRVVLGGKPARIATGVSPRVSRDGSLVAFLNGSHQVALVRPDGTGGRALGIEADNLDIAPDGSRVVFVASGDLHVLATGGGAASRLTSTRGAEGYPRWSPRGDLISFARGREYFVMSTDGARELRIGRIGSHIAAPAAWSVDGSRLAFGSSAGLVVVNADSTGTRRIVTSQGTFQPAWSPDRERLVFSWSSPCPGFDRNGIGLAAVGGGRARMLTQNCIHYGTAGPDRLRGGPDGEIFYGLDGDDRITGGGGQDAIYGGRGDDVLVGDPGTWCPFPCDEVRGGPGDDLVVLGSSGTAYGGPGNDLLRGGNGDDDLDGGPGRDAFRCGRGRDIVRTDRLDVVARDCEVVRR